MDKELVDAFVEVVDLLEWSGPQTNNWGDIIGWGAYCAHCQNPRALGHKEGCTLGVAVARVKTAAKTMEGQQTQD